MKVLFVHQNAPAQFRNVSLHLAASKDNEVVFITQKKRAELPGMRVVEYLPHRKATPQTHQYLRHTEDAVICGQSVFRLARTLKNEGFTPDVIVAHSGWGEALFLKDVFPHTPLVNYCEFYYSPTGANIGFDPEFPASTDAMLRSRILNAHHLLALEMADACYSPTHWQKSRFPTEFHDKINVIHDGIDCDILKPNPEKLLNLARGATVKHGDPIVTYVSRNLEPYRGFHTFMRALPYVFDKQPNTRVIIIGGDEKGYGEAAPNGTTHRQMMLKEVKLPMDRVHFLGRVPFSDYASILQLSAAHVYLTYPFVLSWSCLEAMAVGCPVIGSKTAPVEEVIEDSKNGYLVDFFEPETLGARVAEVLKQRKNNQRLRNAARKTIETRYGKKQCTDELLTLINRMALLHK